MLLSNYNDNHCFYAVFEIFFLTGSNSKSSVPLGGRWAFQILQSGPITETKIKSNNCFVTSCFVLLHFKLIRIQTNIIMHIYNNSVLEGSLSGC